jgi:hypothetical protein
MRMARVALRHSRCPLAARSLRSGIGSLGRRSGVEAGFVPNFGIVAVVEGARAQTVWEALRDAA